MWYSFRAEGLVCCTLLYSCMYSIAICNIEFKLQIATYLILHSTVYYSGGVLQVVKSDGHCNEDILIVEDLIQEQYVLRKLQGPENTKDALLQLNPILLLHPKSTTLKGCVVLLHLLVCVHCCDPTLPHYQDALHHMLHKYTAASKLRHIIRMCCCHCIPCYK